MADAPKSFEEFYYPPDKCNYLVEVVANYADSHDGDTAIYDGVMFCPECNRAGLYFVHKTSKRIAHLRRCPSENHEPGCSYNYPYASRKKAQKYINSLSYNEIQDKLDSMINMLCKSKKKTDTSTGDKNVNSVLKNPMLYTEKNRDKEVIKALRRKSINIWIDEKADKNELFVFYGIVKFEIEEKQKVLEETGDSYSYYILKVYNINKDGQKCFRTSFYRGKTRDSIKEDAFYFIAVIGSVGKKSWQIKPANFHAIKYREII